MPARLARWRGERKRAAAGRTPPLLGPGGLRAKMAAELEPDSGPAVADHCVALCRRRPGGRGVFWVVAR